MKIMSSLALKGVLEELLPSFSMDSGSQIGLTFDPTAAMLKRIEGGERGDLTILTSSGIDGLIANGVLAKGSRVDLAVSEIGIAVKAGAPKPDIATLDAAKRTLLAAKTIVYSRAGASGIFFAKAIEQQGIADAVNAKATIIPAGFTAQLVADGKAELAVQQVSELMAVPGVDVVGPLPDGLQERLTFSGGVFRDAPEAAAATSLLRHLANSEFAGTYRARGVRPCNA